MVTSFIMMAIASFQGKEIEAAFWSVENKISVTGGGVQRQEDRLYLFKGGVALRGFYQQGVDSLDLAKIERDYHYGTWTKAAGKLTIRWAGGANPQTFTADKGNFASSDITWRPLKKVDGVRMEGLFAREDPKNDGSQLMLKADGSFGFRNVHRVNMIDLTKVAPEQGTGTYEVRNWTIYLKFSNGQKASMSFELPHTEEAKTAGFVSMATQNFYRWPGALAVPTTAVQTRPEKIGDLSLSVDTGWIRSDDKQSGATTLKPQNLPGDVLCSVTFTAPQGFQGTEAAWHQSLWGPITEGAGLANTVKGEKLGLFLRSSTRLDRAGKPPMWCSLYTVTSKGKGLAVMFVTNREDLYGPVLPHVDAMLKTAKLP